MANQLTQNHVDVFQKLLRTVDNAGTREWGAHVLDILKETLGVAVPVVEAAVPAATPVITAVEQSVEDIDAQIQKLLAAKAQKMSAASQTTSSAPVAPTPPAQ